MQKIILILSATLLLGLFQNCQKTVSFSASDDGSQKSSGELVPVASEDDSSNEEPGDVVVVDPPSEEGGEPKGPEVPEGPNVPGEDDEDDDRLAEHEKEPSKNPRRRPPQHENEPEGDGYVCIIEGPGKSVKLGMAENGELRGQNAIPSVLCMSAAACTDIVSEKFAVKGPEKRGYCKQNGNPHVTHISDADVAAKILQ